MTQPNGLPSKCKKFDTISSHNFCDNATWLSTEDSSWTLEPGSGEVYVVTGARVVFSEHTKIHSDGKMLIQLYMDASPYPVYTIEYATKSDYYIRCNVMQKLEIDGAGDDVTSSVIALEIPFSQPLILWSSTGTDLLGNYKFNKMVVKIADDEPYTQSDSSPAEMARFRYFIEVYEDPNA